MKIQVYLLGNFGYKTDKLDGQTMELRQMRELLELNQVKDFRFADLSLMMWRPFRIVEMFLKLFKTKHLFYFAAQSNLKYFFPVLYFLAPIAGFRLHYFAVGGWLPEYLGKYRWHQKKLARIPGVYVELPIMRDRLADWYGYKNAYWFPNFRSFDYQANINLPDQNKIKLVFMARINKLKGYPMVFNLLERFDDEGMGAKISVDFYGPLFEKHRADFEERLNQFENAQYLGLLQPKDIYSTLNKYDAMIFPTEYPGEGLPGTIIDSYISGIPVIATTWRYNPELIKNNVSGLLFEPGDLNKLFTQVKSLIEKPDLLVKLKQGALKERYNFDREKAWKIIEDLIKLEVKN